MYASAELVSDKTLYSDGWYLYPPGSRYLSSVLLRLFGIHLTVLCWAGALAALESAIFLFLSFGAVYGCFSASHCLRLSVKACSSPRVGWMLADGIAAPGFLLSAAVIYWMISLRGAEFLTQENLASWPSSHFMRKYGPLWLSTTGLVLSPVAFVLTARSSFAPIKPSQHAEADP